MIEKYRENFRALSPEARELVSRALAARYPETRGLDERDPYDLCARAGLDQADVVMSLAADPSPLAVQALETVVGRPVQVGHPCLSGPPPEDTPPADPAPAPQRRRRAPRRPKSDPRVIVSVTPNPKQPGSKSHARYENYREGMTVSEALEAGLTSADIAHDTKKGFIVLETPEE